MLRNHYIKKKGLFLKRETVMYESDYWQVEEIDASEDELMDLILSYDEH